VSASPSASDQSELHPFQLSAQPDSIQVLYSPTNLDPTMPMTQRMILCRFQHLQPATAARAIAKVVMPIDRHCSNLRDKSKDLVLCFRSKFTSAVCTIWFYASVGRTTSAVCTKWLYASVGMLHPRYAPWPRCTVFYASVVTSVFTTSAVLTIQLGPLEPR
jgi:hypothetical protein